MKKTLKLLISGMVIGAFTLSIKIDNNVQANDVTTTCKYDSQSKVNPNYATTICLLTETALKYDVPPEIVKAIAEGESGKRQFDENGEAIVTTDNGIGIMQVTNQDKYPEESLKNDLAFNIKAGVEILDSMFKRTDLPSINGRDRDVLENWYFAIMAYNGTKPVNSPFVQATGERNTKAYQEKIIRIIKEKELIEFKELPFSSGDFQYDSNSTGNIKFAVKDYNFDLSLTKSKYKFETNQKVIATTNGVKIRPRPNTTDSNLKGTLSKGETVTITGPFVYDETTKTNHFVWYPVKTSNGTTGYVASSYLDYPTATVTPEPTPITFKDVPDGHYAKKAIYYLAERGILNGVGSNKFGLGQGLTRWQAVLLINRANNVSTVNPTDPGFTDVPKTYKYYNDIAAAVDAKLFNGTSATKFEPDRILTRAEMATVLQRLYKFPTPTSSHPFTDVKKGDWFADSVSALYAAGITDGVSATKFDPNATIKREQFAVFLARSMDETFRK